MTTRPLAPDASPTDAGISAGMPSPLDAVPDMRATAKWILGASAAVGAALVGGAPLTAVGKIHGAGHAILAYVGLALGLAGVGWAIWRTADALVPPLTTPLSLDRDKSLEDLRQRIAKDVRAFYGPFGNSMAEIERQYEFHQRMARVLADAVATEPDADRRQVMWAQLRGARAAVSAAQARIRTLLELSHAWQVRSQLRDARLHALLGAAIAAAGAVLFLVSTS